jgi:tetratricopeptide (TPR) repeat protein
MTGDPVFDDTLKQALAVDLDQSPYLNVVSDQKISETLLGRQPDQRVTVDVARDLCQRVGSKAMLAGSIANLGNQYVVVLKVTNCAAGDSLAAEQVRAENKDQILAALDKAASSLRGRLGESLHSIEKYATPVEQASTPSLAALQAYGAGLQAWEHKGNEAAIPFYKRAIELDPNFAMAYAHLGQAYANMGQDSPAIENSKEAFKLRDRVSEREVLHRLPLLRDCDGRRGKVRPRTRAVEAGVSPRGGAGSHTGHTLPPPWTIRRRSPRGQRSSAAGTKLRLQRCRFRVHSSDAESPR